MAQAVYDVRTFGAVGDGRADDTAAFAACRDAILATTRPTGSVTNLPVNAQFVIPPGRYLLTGDNCLMTPGGGVTSGISGLTIRGAGRETTTLVWAPTATNVADPTVGNLFSATNRAKFFHIADLTVEIANPDANVFYFRNDGQGAHNEGNVFERLHFRGTANRVFGFDGGPTANLNSEMTFRNISCVGAYRDAFFRVGGISGTYNQQNQFLNYWLYDTSMLLKGGTLFKFDRGGAAHFINGSWSASAADAPDMTFLSMPLPNYNNTSATQYTVRGIRFEPKAAGHAVIDCRTGQGSVTFESCSDSGALQYAASKDYNLHRYSGGAPWGPGIGPTVRYRDCALAGYHTYTGPTQALGKFIYEGCSVYRGGSMRTAVPTQSTGPDALLRWTGGAPRYAFRDGWNYADTAP